MRTTSTDTDTDRLLQLARAGDGEALGRLLAMYRNYLAILARTQIRRRLQGKADASDLVQEVCLEAHQHFQQFRGGSAPEFAGWLRGIMAHMLAKHARFFLGTKQRDARLEQSLAMELNDASSIMDHGLVGNTPSPSENAVTREATLQLAESLESLPADYRQVIILRHLEGLSFADVARAMERTVDSVEKLWVRGLARLRLSLEQRNG